MKNLNLLASLIIFHYGNNSVVGVASLLDQGLDINAADKDGNTLLIRACLAGRSDVTAYLLSRKASPALINNNGETCLHAFFKGKPSLSACERLINWIVDMDIQDNHQKTALHVGVEMLISLNVPQNSQEWAIFHQPIEFLVDRGANLWLADQDGHTSGDLILNFNKEPSHPDLFSKSMIEKVKHSKAIFDKSDILNQLPDQEHKISSRDPKL